MRIIFSVIILVHGLIHLLGFLKAFEIQKIKELSVPVSSPMGVAWAFCSLLFIVYSVLYLLNHKYSWLVGFIAVVLSQILVVYFWQDAKFGSMANLVILVVVMFSYGNFRFNRLVDRETKNILSNAEFDEIDVLQEKEIYGLPLPVQTWLKTSGAVGRRKVILGKIEQKAKMKMKPEQDDWYEASALQFTTIEPPAFIWCVNVAMNDLLKFKGRDKFVDGKGEMLIKMNSFIKIVDEKGEKLNEGSIQRYLGEMVWFPSIALSEHVVWDQVDELTARATINYENISGSGTFRFNGKGDVVSFSAFRYKDNTPDAKRYEWLLTVDDYAVFEGIKVPAKMKATWKLDEGDWTWLHLKIANIAYNENAIR